MIGGSLGIIDEIKRVGREKEFCQTVWLVQTHDVKQRLHRTCSVSNPAGSQTRSVRLVHVVSVAVLAAAGGAD